MKKMNRILFTLALSLLLPLIPQQILSDAPAYFQVPSYWRQPLCTATSESPRHFLWWAALEDPILNQIIDLATCNNPDILLAYQKTFCSKDPTAKDEYRSQWTDIAAEAARAYIDLRTYEEKCKIMSQTAASLHDTAQLTDSLLAAGFGNSIELLQAQEQEQTLIAEIPTLLFAIDKAQNRLSVLLGYYPGDIDALLCSSSINQMRLPQCHPIGTPCGLVLDNPSLRKAEAAARLGALPCLTYKKTVYESFEAVENALSALHQDLRKITYFESAEEKARQTYFETINLYRKGLKNYLEVELLGRSYLTAQIMLLESKSAVLKDYVSLYQALGGGW